VLGVPLAGAAVGAIVGGAGVAVSATVGIEDNFVRDVEASDEAGNLRAVRPGQRGRHGGDPAWIRGLGGTIMKTNVDVERRG